MNVLFVQYFVDESDKYLSCSTSSTGLGLVTKNIVHSFLWHMVTYVSAESTWHPALEVHGLVARPAFTINSTGLAAANPKGMFC